MMRDVIGSLPLIGFFWILWGHGSSSISSLTATEFFGALGLLAINFSLSVHMRLSSIQRHIAELDEKLSPDDDEQNTAA